MSEFYLTKTLTGFAPATEQDLESCQAYKVGDVIRVKAQRPRNGQHHRKGFALLQLGFTYWEPPESLLTAGERHMASVIAGSLEAAGGRTGAITAAIKEIVEVIEYERADQHGTPEKSFTAFRKDITIRAGFYDVQMTPSGITKTAQSLSFDKMPQEDFNTWYKAAFGVLWNLIMSRHFDSKDDMENAVNKMLDYA